MVSIYSISIAFAVAFLIIVIRMVQKRKLMEKHSLLWVFFGVLLIGLSISPFTIEKIARFLDIKYAPSVLFIFGVVYIIVYSLHLTTLISKQSQMILKLTQELTILKQKTEKIN